MEKEKNIIVKIKDLTIIITCISVSLSIFIGVNSYINSNKEIRFTGLEQAKYVLQNEENIKDSIENFLNIYHNLNLESLKDKYENGKNLYYSKELSGLRFVCHHYEIVGALIDKGYIDFDLYYSIVPFPDEFLDKTTNLRHYIKENWNGQGKPLTDFLSNLYNLKKKYEQQRIKEKRKKNN